MDAYAAMPPAHLMIGLVELDVTDAEATISRLQGQGTRVSMFAFVVRSIAVAIAEHPDLNLVQHGKRLVRFDDVDVAVPVEVTTPEGKYPRQVVVRGAQRLTTEQIYACLEQAKHRFSSTGTLGREDRWTRQMMRLFRGLPRFVRIRAARLFLRSAFTIKRQAGTTLVTSVGKFASVPGFAFSFTTGPRAAAFAVGSVVPKPWVREGRVAVRSILSLSIMVNHDLVDGAPAARFCRRLQQLIEAGEGLPVAASEPAQAMQARSGVAQEMPLSSPT
jgi:pyruvate/2-oxoglutarate dehydrogenase complex dihydrolipoamide acyltransferase (E2) component